MPHFQPVNYLVLAVYFGGMISIGAYFRRGHRTPEDFLLAGRSMTWGPIAISIMATIQTSISYIGVPAWVFRYDMSLYLGTIGILLAVPVLNIVFLPFFYSLKVSTAYEYLEARFGREVSTVSSLLFLVTQAVYLSVVIYAPALVFALIGGLPLSSSVVIMVALTACYTAMGGIKAVIWTEVVQFFMKLGGVVISVWFAFHRIDGGWGQFWRIGHETGKLRLFHFSPNPTVTVSFWGCAIGGIFTYVAMYGANQTVVQRYLTGRSLQQERRALLFQALFLIPFGLLMYGLGAVLYVFYHVHPTLLDKTINPDNIFPYFIVQELPVGLSGLIIADIFAAAMASCSSAINSLTTVTVNDFYKKLWRPHASPEHYVRIARITTVLWATFSGILALVVGKAGPLVVIVSKLVGPFFGTLLAVFLLGLLTRKATQRGIVVGMLAGSALSYSVVLLTRLSFMWYEMLGCISVFVIGYVTSLADHGRVKLELTGLVFQYRGRENLKQ